MASINKTTSPYFTTSIRDFYLDVLTLREIPASSNDKLVTIEAKYENRPDLFANDVYGSARLWWVLPVRNRDILIDPIADFKAGVQIFVPTAETIREII